MSSGAGKDEMGIVAILHVGAYLCLYIGIAVLCNLLEFIDGDQAGTVRVLKIIENLIQCGCWRLDIANAHCPGWLTINVKRNTVTHRR